MLKRKLALRRLHPDRLEEYLDYHRNVWPELLVAYRKAGIHSISCFLNGLQLAVYSEYDDSVPQIRAEIGSIEQRWAALMEPLADPSSRSIEFEEVFRMPPEAV